MDVTDEKQGREISPSEEWASELSGTADEAGAVSEEKGKPTEDTSGDCPRAARRKKTLTERVNANSTPNTKTPYFDRAKGICPL